MSRRLSTIARPSSSPLEKLEGRSHPRNVTDASVDSSSVVGPAFTSQSTRRKGAFAKKISRAPTFETLDTLFRPWTRLEGRPKLESDLETSKTSGQNRDRNTILFIKPRFTFPHQYLFLNIFSQIHVSLSYHYPRLYLSNSIYIKLYQPPSPRNIHPFHLLYPPAEHRNSVEKILGRKRKKSGVETATWKRSRSNDRGGGEVDIARCAAVSRWRRRERRLAGFRGCTVGTSPSPCIPIDR